MPLFFIVLNMCVFFILPIAIIGQEDCYNSIDDDLDGYVDFFDIDCPCLDTLFNAQCSLECQYLPDTFPKINMKLKWITGVGANGGEDLSLIATGDIDNDGVIEVVTTTPNSQGVVIFDGNTGELERTINVSTLLTGVTLADINRDGYSEIFITVDEFLSTHIECYTYDGIKLWESVDLTGYNQSFESRGYHSNIADFNEDGISEIYFGSVVLNANNGIIILNGLNGIGASTNTASGKFSLNLHSIAGDFLPTPGLELAAGNSVYSFIINNLNGLAGNFVNVTLAPPEVLDGLTSMADIDMDGELDVITVYNRGNPSQNRVSNVWVWNPRNQTIICKYEFSDDGSLAFVGDVDGDCSPEIGILKHKEIQIFKYNGAPDLELSMSIPNSDASGTTGITMFDFNQDGMNEIIHRDEDSLAIFSGLTGQKLGVYPCRSPTAFEYPTISDIDLDGQAEILVMNENFQVLCLETASFPWAPCRSVWNQYGYHVTNINDDLTVPIHQQNNAVILSGTENCIRDECSTPYNNFLTQATLRTQEGCVIWKASSLTGEIDCINFNKQTGRFELTFSITNLPESSLNAVAGIVISIFNGDPQLGGVKIGEYITLNQLNIGETLSNLQISFDAIGDETEIFLVINSNGLISNNINSSSFNLTECNYLDNIIGGVRMPILAKDTITICDGQSINWQDTTLNTEGEYFRIIKGFKGCDSVIATIQIEEIESFKIKENIESCDVHQYKDSLYKASTIIVDSLQSVFGCDSIITIDLKVNKSSTLMETLSGCDSILWNGRYLHDSGLYRDTLINGSGCDSILILNLELPKSLTVIETVNACDSIYWNENYYSESGQYRFDTKSNQGCDSTIILNLEISKSFTREVIEVSCDSFLWQGVYLKSSGSYQDTFLNQNNCDSIVNFQLTINRSDYFNRNEIACDSFIWENETYYDSGVYETQQMNITGCDSIEALNLTVLQSSFSSNEIVECDSFQWNGLKYYQTGSYKYTSTNQVGCDSIASLDLQINKSSIESINLSACDSIDWENEIYYDSGVEEYQTMNLEGCDSTIILKLEVFPSYVDTIFESVCDTLWYEGQSYTETGQFTLSSQSIWGCDSILILDVNISNEISEENIMACDSFYWDVTKEVYRNSEFIKETYTKSDGCDSTYLLNLEINPSYYYEERVDTFESYTWVVNGMTYTNTGKYEEDYITTIGCDSIHVLYLELEEADYYWPNIINPTSVFNYGFTIYGNEAIEEILDLIIYDRWGNKIWHRSALRPSEIDLGWDGKANGQEVNPGVYVWVANLALRNGKVVTEGGDVTVIK